MIEDQKIIYKLFNTVDKYGRDIVVLFTDEGVHEVTIDHLLTSKYFYQVRRDILTIWDERLIPRKRTWANWGGKQNPNIEFKLKHKN